MTPKDLNSLMPLLIGLLVVTGIVFVIDFVLLTRWIIYQVQLSKVSAAPEAAYGEYPTTPMIPPPFAPTWSLVHPFLSIQFIVVVVNVLALMVIGVIMGVTWFTGGINALQKPELMSNAILYTEIFGAFILNAFFVGVVAWWLKRYRTSLPEIGLRRPTQQQILLGLGLGLALFLVATGLEQGVTALMQKTLPHGTIESLKKLTETVNLGSKFQEIANFWLKACLFAAAALAAPMGEEVFFRGFVYNALKRRINVLTAIVLSGLFFAVMHIGPLAVVVIFPMGMLLAYVYERTKSLWVTILMHAVHNGMTLGLLWLFPQLAK